MRPAILVSTDGEAQPEGEDQADDSEQRTLQYADRFPVGIGISPRVAAEQHTDNGRAPDHGEDQDAELPTAEREEQSITKARRASGQRSPAQPARDESAGWSGGGPGRGDVGAALLRDPRPESDERG